MALKAVFTAGVILCVSPSFASMPTLTHKPRAKNFESCRAWATKQDADAINMWGTTKSGTSSADIAIARLTAVCLGDDMPEIVGFSSSAGAAESYCETHKETKICKDRPAE